MQPRPLAACKFRELSTAAKLDETYKVRYPSGLQDFANPHQSNIAMLPKEEGAESTH